LGKILPTYFGRLGKILPTYCGGCGKYYLPIFINILIINKITKKPFYIYILIILLIIKIDDKGKILFFLHSKKILNKKM